MASRVVTPLAEVAASTLGAATIEGTLPIDEEHAVSSFPLEFHEVYAGRPFLFSSLFPPLTWIPAYIRSLRGRSTEDEKEAMGLLPYSLAGDMIAGLTVGIMLVPQSLGFALIAGLPLRSGLYSSFLPLLSYALTGSIRQAQVGPTALMSLITGGALDAAGYVNDERVAFAALLSCFVAIFNIVFGIFRFGFIVDFMSHSVMVAFCTASGMIIATSQLNTMLGFKIPRSEYWWENVRDLVENLHLTTWPTTLMGFSLLCFLMFMKGWKVAGSMEQRRKHPVWRCLPLDKTSRAFRALKLVADLSSVFSVSIGWVWGLCYRTAGINSVKLVGKTNVKGFEFYLPGSGLAEIQWDSLMSSALTITLVGFIETLAIGARLAAESRYTYDANQEFFGLGLSNLASSVMSGFPVTGGFSRTSVNALFGATSQVAGVVTGLVVLLAVYAIMPVVELLPQVALAPLNIQGALSIMSINSFKAAFQTSKYEFFLMVATFLVSMGFTVKEGLMTGVGLSILKLVYDVAMPNIVVCGQVKDGSFRDLRYYPEAHVQESFVVVRMDAALTFANARRFQDFCLRAARAQSRFLSHGGTTDNNMKCVIVDVKSINGVDITGIETIESLAETLHQRGQSLILANLKGSIVKLLLNAHVDAHLRKRGGCLCWNMTTALAIARAKGGEANEESTDLLDEAHEELTDLLNRINLSIKPHAGVPATRVLRLAGSRVTDVGLV